MEEETNGTTFSKIFKTIWHCKWVTLAVAVLVTLFSAITPVSYTHLTLPTNSLV